MCAPTIGARRARLGPDDDLRATSSATASSSGTSFAATCRPSTGARCSASPGRSRIPSSDGDLPARLLGALEDAIRRNRPLPAVPPRRGLRSGSSSPPRCSPRPGRCSTIANLIRKMRFPRQLVPLSVVATQLISFAVDARRAARRELRAVAACPGHRVGWHCRSGSRSWRSRAGWHSPSRRSTCSSATSSHLVSALLLPLFFLTPCLSARQSADRAARLGARSSAGGTPLTPLIEALRAPALRGSLPRLGDVVYLSPPPPSRSRSAPRLQPRRRPDRSRSSDPHVVDPRLVAFGLRRRQACDLGVRLERREQ